MVHWILPIPLILCTLKVKVSKRKVKKLSPSIADYDLLDNPPPHSSQYSEAQKQDRESDFVAR